MKPGQRWQDWLNLILGLCLIITPFVAGVMTATELAAWNSYIFGTAIVAISVWALIRPLAWEEWSNLGLAVWLILSPLVLGFSTEMVPMWDHLLIGMLVAVDAMWALPPA